jgi:hypothetical protein
VLFRLPVVELDSQPSSTEIVPLIQESPEPQSASGFEQPGADQPAQVRDTWQAPTATVTPPVVASPTVSKSTLSSASYVGATNFEPLRVQHSSASRSWWEHWSSGIVLIVLVIALIAASILAFNDATTAPDHPLADVTAEAKADLDVGDIPIPRIEIPASVQPIASSPSLSTPQLVSDQPSSGLQQDSAITRSLELEVDVSSAESSLAESSSAQTLVTAPKQEIGSDRLDALKGNQDLGLQSAPESAMVNSLIPGELELSLSTDDMEHTQPAVSKAGTVASSGNLTTAQLQAPVALDLPPLFPHTPSSQPGSGQSDAQGSMGVPSRTVSTSSEVPSIAPGQSPAFYDGAAIQTSPAGFGGAPDGRMNFAPRDTQQPAYTALLSGATPATAAPVTTAGHNGLTTSDTPNLESDALFRSYQRFMEMNKAQNMPTENRYPAGGATPNGSPTIGGTGPTTRQPMGFTLGAPSAATPTQSTSQLR